MSPISLRVTSLSDSCTKLTSSESVKLKSRSLSLDVSSFLCNFLCFAAGTTISSLTIFFFTSGCLSRLDIRLCFNCCSSSSFCRIGVLVKISVFFFFECFLSGAAGRAVGSGFTLYGLTNFFSGVLFSLIWDIDGLLLSSRTAIGGTSACCSTCKSVTDAAMKSCSLNMLLLNGYIPVALNPDMQFFGVKANG
ncbi:unnamed protein product [Acanthoscelides obtectus]|uniref:Uncharacterized protein n=1 Tax=Acanthoscelides obtectus TaxID=200917 RepID=A0A9P0K7P3_ACAOB|nr:unnamed protein product [Acanthoscelides obtectus]CAK1673461.1 hypothetical protein AOBTE_LOCUS29346 [Acanthoscelides obtectus]